MFLICRYIRSRSFSITWILPDFIIRNRSGFCQNLFKTIVVLINYVYSVLAIVIDILVQCTKRTC